MSYKASFVVGYHSIGVPGGQSRTLRKCLNVGDLSRSVAGGAFVHNV